MNGMKGNSGQNGAPSKIIPFLPVMDTERLMTVVLFIAIFAMTARPAFSHDTWWHLRSGQYMVENRTILRQDVFSYTRYGETWIDHGWLAQILIYLVYYIFGWPGLSVGIGIIVTFSFWLVWRQCEELNVFIRGFVIALMAIASSVIWMARPQIFSFLLTAIMSYLLDRYKRGNGHILPYIPLLTLLWANIHGGYAVSFVLMGCYLVGEVVNFLTSHYSDPTLPLSKIGQIVVTMVVSFLVVVINPHGWVMWVYPFQTVGIGALQSYVLEWQSPNFHVPVVQMFLFALLLLFVSLGRVGRRADWTDLALAGCFTTMSLIAARNIPLFALVVGPVIIRYLDEAWREQESLLEPHPRLDRIFRALFQKRELPPTITQVVNYSIVGVLLIAAMINTHARTNSTAQLEKEKATMPYEAAECLLRESPPGPMYNDYNLGGYLIYKLWPKYPVYLDGRTDLYGDYFIRKAVSISQAESGWDYYLSERGVNLLFLERQNPLAMVVFRDNEWRLLCFDDVSFVYVRRNPILSKGEPHTTTGTRPVLSN